MLSRILLIFLCPLIAWSTPKEKRARLKNYVWVKDSETGFFFVQNKKGEIEECKPKKCISDQIENIPKEDKIRIKQAKIDEQKKTGEDTEVLYGNNECHSGKAVSKKNINKCMSGALEEACRQILDKNYKLTEGVRNVRTEMTEQCKDGVDSFVTVDFDRDLKIRGFQAKFKTSPKIDCSIFEKKQEVEVNTTIEEQCASLQTLRLKYQMEGPLSLSVNYRCKNKDGGYNNLKNQIPINRNSEAI